MIQLNIWYFAIMYPVLNEYISSTIQLYIQYYDIIPIIDKYYCIILMIEFSKNV